MNEDVPECSSFVDKLLFENLDFLLPPGGIVGVIGPNGAGKSTLFKMIIGQETPDSGTIAIGETVKMGFVDQSRDDLDAKKNVWEESHVPILTGIKDAYYPAGYGKKNGVCQKASSDYEAWQPK